MDSVCGAYVKNNKGKLHYGSMQDICRTDRNVKLSVNKKNENALKTFWTPFYDCAKFTLEGFTSLLVDCSVLPQYEKEMSMWVFIWGFKQNCINYALRFF